MRMNPNLEISRG